MRRHSIALAASWLLVLTACGGGSDVTDSATNTAPEASASAQAAATEEPSEAEPAGVIVKSGFGQEADYAWVTSVVRNDADAAGQTVTVQYNLKDASGAIIASTDQVESFSRPGELLAVGTQVEVPQGAVPAMLEANLLIEENGIGQDYPEIPVDNVTVGQDEFGEPQVSFEITNPTSEPLQNPRIGVVCLNAAGDVIGGTSEFPTLVPANGTIRVDTLSLITSGQPAVCEVYAGGPL